MKKIVVLLFVLLTCTAWLSAEVLTVSLTEGRYRNPTQAFAAVKSGDTIRIQEGVYYIDAPLVLSNVSNILIEGEGEVNIVSTSLYDDIIVFENCTDIVLSNIGAYHEEMDYCSGRVLVLAGCRNIGVKQCFLSGCGSIGVDIESSTAVSLDGNFIYDNSWAGVNVGANNSQIYLIYNNFMGNYQDVLYEGEDYSEFIGDVGPITMMDNFFPDPYASYDDEDDYGYGYGEEEPLFYPEYTNDYYYFDDVVFTSFYNDREPYSGKTLRVGKTGAQYTSIQRAIDQARNGDTVFILPGEYIIDSPITVRGKKKITIESDGDVHIILTSGYANVINLENSGDVTLRRLSARHEEEGGCWAGVVRIFHVQNVLIEFCELNGCGQIGINLEGRCDSLTVRNCYIHSNSSYAGYLYMYKGILNFEHNLVENNGGPLQIHDDDYYFTIYDSGDIDVLEEQLGLSMRGFNFYDNYFYSNRGGYDYSDGYEDDDWYGGAAQ